MARLVVTGASGYIGKRLTELAAMQGHAVVALGREAPPGAAAFFPWRLGDAAPPEAFAGADAVIHLAHSWKADSDGGENRNEIAGEKLARDALAAGVPRFVFASTNSAKQGARNVYGRVKFALESRLAALPGAQGRVVSARIALVYGGPPAGQYALMRKITALTPILPMIGLERGVQPIHRDEVCRALLSLAVDKTLTRNFYVVAGPPIAFAAWLKILRKVQTGGGLLLIPIPLGLMLLACNIFPFLRERVLGLAAAEPMPSAESLAALGLVPGDPFSLLLQEENQNRGGEARALLRYLTADPVTADMERALATALARDGLAPLGLPLAVLRHPGLLGFFDPPANRHANRLARALHLASQVLEAQPQKRARPLRDMAVIALDLAALPIRHLLARRYK